MSPYFSVEEGILYNQDKTKLICHPPCIINENIKIIDSVNVLERGSFSGCDKMESINLNNVEVISKNCFTNCISLKEIICNEKVYFIGEWAFGHCKNLKKIIIKNKDCYIDKNISLNTDAIIIKDNTYIN